MIVAVTEHWSNSKALQNYCNNFYHDTSDMETIRAKIMCCYFEFCYNNYFLFMKDM